jgi:predicted alpha/beta-fold hydrolase
VLLLHLFLCSTRWSIFNGARTSDAHAAALALRKTLGEHQVLVGVGYSMGAIVLSNYVASYGESCALDGAISISGGLDMRYQEHFFRAQRLWQPMLAETLRDEFLLGKWGHRVKERLSSHDFLRMMRASHVTVSIFFSCCYWVAPKACFSPYLIC